MSDNNESSESSDPLSDADEKIEQACELLKSIKGFSFTLVGLVELEGEAHADEDAAIIVNSIKGRLPMQAINTLLRGVCVRMEAEEFTHMVGEFNPVVLSDNP